MMGGEAENFGASGMQTLTKVQHARCMVAAAPFTPDIMYICSMVYLQDRGLPIGHLDLLPDMESLRSDISVHRWGFTSISTACQPCCAMSVPLVCTCRRVRVLGVHRLSWAQGLREARLGPWRAEALFAMQVGVWRPGQPDNQGWLMAHGVSGPGRLQGACAEAVGSGSAQPFRGAARRRRCVLAAKSGQHPIRPSRV